MLKIATWNVNSIRVRLPHLLAWLAQQQPDIVALQETKVVDEQFPHAELLEAGYHCVFSGQKTYNGVAVLSRLPVKDIVTDFSEVSDPQRRLLAVTYGQVRIINVYVPNGGEIDSDKFIYKLAWLAQLKIFLKMNLQQYPCVILLGDFNIAPHDKDIYDASPYDALTHPQVRAVLTEIQALGMYDVFEKFPNPTTRYTWWDYRAASFRRNLGIRIDLIFASTESAKHCQACYVDTMPRYLERPSDHAPLLAEFSV